MTQPPRYPYPPMPVPPGRPVAVPAYVEPIPGTDFGLAYAALPAVTSGQAVGALVAGIVAIMVSLVMICFGLIGASRGWGALVAGAFAILGALLSVAAITVARYAQRRIAASRGAFQGTGMAVAGLVCGIVALALTVVGFAGTLAATLAG